MIEQLDISAKERLFVQAYFEAIDFTDCGDTDQPEHGEELDESFERESLIDCLAFYSRVECYISDYQIEQCGHDFWLTRQGHGTGFWDRPEIYGEVYAKRFTAQAESFGEAYPVFENCHLIT